MPDSRVVLVADVGGTNTRLALAHATGAGPIRLSGESSQSTARIDRFADTLREYLRGQKPVHLDGCAVCAAGPLQRDAAGEHIRLTNASLAVTGADLRAGSGVERCALLNDFTAIALSLPALQAGDLRHLGGPTTPGDGPRAVLGPGTGLGISGLLGSNGPAAAIAGEGGHVDLAACGRHEDDVIRKLRAQGGHVSAERVLSGPGLERLYLAAAEVLGADPVRRPAREIAERAFGARDDIAREAVALFTRWLGRVAGNLALTLGAGGGVYVAGGIVPAWGEHFDAALFREGFEDKGSYRGYMERIPAWVVVHPYPALLGLARAV